MAALAPITNETPAWDVLDPFPESHARARQTKSGNPLSKSLTYSYDSVGNRRSLDAPDSGRFSYVYDAAEQLSSVLNPFSELTTFSYDIAGRRTVQRYSNGTRASIIYDTANNVTQFHNRTSTGTAITTNDYKYDNVGNRTGMLEASGDRLTWTYDNGDQLKSERRSGASGYANTFTYDGVGNRTLKNAGATRTTFSYDVADQLVYSQAVAGRTSYVYDNAGNQQIERPPTGSRTTTVWDNENRPTLYRLPDTSLVTMSYNGNNRRVTKQSATETVKFVWDPAADAYLAEFNGSNVLQATYSQEPVQFGRAISQQRSTTSSWYHTDALGSTQALSNSSQVTSDTYLYDAWGNPITSTGTTVNPFRWVGNVGYYFDSDTGLYYIRARTYQPTIARWTSADPLFYMLAKAGALGAFTRDPIGFKAGDPNLYRYVGDKPVSRIDPSGLESWIPFPTTNSGCIVVPTTGQVVCGPPPPVGLTSLCAGISSCPDCDATICAAAQKEIQDAFNSANGAALGTLNGWLEARGLGSYGGRCHYWSGEFCKDRNCKPANRGSCLNVTGYIIQLDGNSRWVDHNVNVIKNRCSGKCTVVDDGFWGTLGQVYDPCNVPTPPLVGPIGQGQWDSIRAGCGCGAGTSGGAVR